MKHPITAHNLDEVAFNDDGLVPVIAQERVTGQILMLAWANRESLEASLSTGRMTYWSRSRQSLWAKGDTSGHTQQVVALALDCDKDAILAIVEQKGAACHEGSTTCWGDAGVATELGVLEDLARGRQASPAGRYSDSLLSDADLVAAKIVEEAQEVASVLRGEPNDDSLEHEAADLLYHLVMGLRGAGVDVAAVLAELRRRS